MCQTDFPRQHRSKPDRRCGSRHRRVGHRSSARDCCRFPFCVCPRVSSPSVTSHCWLARSGVEGHQDIVFAVAGGQEDFVLGSDRGASGSPGNFESPLDFLPFLPGNRIPAARGDPPLAPPRQWPHESLTSESPAPEERESAAAAGRVSTIAGSSVTATPHIPSDSNRNIVLSFGFENAKNASGEMRDTGESTSLEITGNRPRGRVLSYLPHRGVY